MNEAKLTYVFRHNRNEFQWFYGVRVVGGVTVGIYYRDKPTEKQLRTLRRRKRSIEDKHSKITSDIYK